MQRVFLQTPCEDRRFGCFEKRRIFDAFKRTALSKPPLFTCCHVLGYRVKVSAKGLILRRPPLPNGRCE